MNFAHSLHRDRRHCAAGVARAALAYAALVLGLVSGTAGIPEPSLVWYGKVLTVTGGNTVRLTTGTLTWRIEPAGGGAPWTVSTTLTNINDQFSYVVQIPCESPEPGVNDAPGVVVLKSPPSGYGRVTVTLDGQPLNISSAPTTFSPTLTDRGRPERIDLTLGAVPPDSDGDGMSDAWEELYFGPAGANPNDDDDGDGLSNLREYRAGTHPKDAQSVFEVVEVTPVQNGVRLRWSSVAGKTYRVRRSSTLLADPATYAVLQANLAATPPLNELTDTSVTGGTTFFYLIEVQP